MSKSIYSTEQRKQQAHEIHNNKYDYSLWTDNILLKDIIVSICPVHGNFTQSLRAHIIRKCGCKKCATSNRNRTNLNKYGTENVNQQHISKQTLDKLNSRKWLIEQHHVHQKTLSQILHELGDVHSNKTITNYLRKHNIETRHYFQSTGEKQVVTFLTTLGVKILTNSHSIIPQYELDIYIPSHNIAIEYNGEYWHGNDYPQTQKRDKRRRVLCKKKNIQLIVIWNNDWRKNDIHIKQKLTDLLS